MAKGRFLDIFYEPLKKLDPAKALEKAIIKNNDALVELNRQQLDKGLDANGKSLGRYKRFSYKGRFQPVDLKLTGDYRAKFTIEVDSKKRVSRIFSQDWKDDLLVWMKGKAVTGIPQSLMPNAREIVREDFERFFKEQLR